MNGEFLIVSRGWNLILRGQLDENFFPQLLYLTKMLLIFQEPTIQFERFIDGKMMSQHHVSQVNWIRENSFFGEFFERGIGIVVIHNSTPTSSLFPTNRADAQCPVIGLCHRRRQGM